MTFGRAVALTIALALGVAGCGSTVQNTGRRAALGGGAGGEAGELGGRSTTPAATGEGQSASGAASATGGAGGQGGSAATGSGAAGTGSSGSATAAGGTASAPTAPGVTADSITIGIEYKADDAVNQAAGVQGTDAGDIPAYWRVVIDDLNKRGGILGRQVKPLYRSYTADQQPSPTDQQQACSFFTEDHKVFAVLARLGMVDAFRNCLQSRGVVAIAQGGLGDVDAETYRQFPTYVTAGAFTLDRVARATVERLWAQGYFTPKSRVGLLTFDAPAYSRAVQRAYEPALAAHSIKFTDKVAVSQPQDSSDLPAESAAVSSAVLKFKSDRIDRVVFLESGGDLALLFMTTAESQGYHPRYGMNSQDAGQVLAANVPADQLHGAIGIGWLATVDVSTENDPPRWPGRQHCYDLMRANRVAFPSPYAELVADTVCDQAGLVAAALAAGGAPTSDRLMAGLNSLGRSFPLAATFAGLFGPDNHDGAGAVRDVAFEDGCRCFHYTSGDEPAQ